LETAPPGAASPAPVPPAAVTTEPPASAPVVLEAPDLIELGLVDVPELAIKLSEETIMIAENSLPAMPAFVQRLAVAG
jgi:hypothetical protein